MVKAISRSGSNIWSCATPWNMFPGIRPLHTKIKPPAHPRRTLPCCLSRSKLLFSPGKSTVWRTSQPAEKSRAVRGNERDDAAVRNVEGKCARRRRRYCGKYRLLRHESGCRLYRSSCKSRQRNGYCRRAGNVRFRFRVSIFDRNNYFSRTISTP